MQNYFNEDFYLDNNPDVLKAIGTGEFKSGYQHFQEFGIHEGRNFHPAFDPEFYLKTNPDIAKEYGENNIAAAIKHFFEHGITEGRAPNQYFDVKHYLNANQDISKALTNGDFKSAIEHFIMFGFKDNHSFNRDISISDLKKVAAENGNDEREYFEFMSKTKDIFSKLEEFRKQLTNEQNAGNKNEQFLPPEPKVDDEAGTPVIPSPEPIPEDSSKPEETPTPNPTPTPDPEPEPQPLPEIIPVKITGTKYAETISGSDGNDTILAKSGDDIIYGKDGADSIKGENGNDTLHGGDGNDTLDGGSGNDVIYAEGGNNLLIGGSGNDIFVFDKHSKLNAIKDFKDGSDKIDISDFNINEKNFETRVELVVLDKIYYISVDDVTIANLGKLKNVTIDINDFIM